MTMSMSMLVSFLSLASALGQPPQSSFLPQVIPRASNCSGFLVALAGSAAYDGCYVIKNSSDGVTFVKDAGHEMYQWEGCWHIGLKGEYAGYTSSIMSSYPPQSDGGCSNIWAPVSAGAPCPQIHWSGSTPLPPAPPAPPPPPTPPPPPPPPPARLVWEDNFDGQELNTSNWNILEQVHRGGVYTKENVMIRDGALVMRTIAQNLTIRQGDENVSFYVSSGAVNSTGLRVQHTGRWEVSVKLPVVSKSPGYTLHSSIWLFDESCRQEIDVVEQYTNGANLSSVAAANIHPFNHTEAACTKVPGGGVSQRTYGDFTTNFTVFTVDWTDSWISMFINGKPYANFQQDSPHTAGTIASFTDKLFLALTACVMDRTPPTSADDFPLEYLVDYVRVYEWI